MMQLLESLGLAAVVLLGLRDGFASARAAAAAPGNVTDLAAIATTDSTITLQWTEVASGIATPAAYDVRYGPAASYAWWLVHFTPPDTVRGTTAAGGAKLQLVVRGLQPSTAYSFEVVAFTGTLNVNAVFSAAHSNVAPGMTAARPPPPPPPAVAASVTINQSVVELVGQRTPLVATVRDQNGAVMPAPITRASRNPNVATVDSAGVVLGVAPEVDTVTATAGTARGQTLVTFQAPPPPPPPSAVAIGVAQAIEFAGFGIPWLSGTYSGVFRDSTGVSAHWTLTITVP